MTELDPLWVVVTVVVGILVGIFLPIGIVKAFPAQTQSIGLEVEMKQVIFDEGTPHQRCYDVFTRGLSGLEVRAFPCPEKR